MSKGLMQTWGVKEVVLDAGRGAGVSCVRRSRPWQQRARPGEGTARAAWQGPATETHKDCTPRERLWSRSSEGWGATEGV